MKFKYDMIRQFYFTVLPVHLIPNDGKNMIKDLFEKSKQLELFPCCAGKNTIILGNFSQAGGVRSRFDVDEGETEQIKPSSASTPNDELHR